MKILAVGDIHGRHEMLVNALHKFETEGYDKIIQLGDLADSYDRTNEDILRCFKLAHEAKECHGNNYIQLIGNHELHYLYGVDYLCSGHRADLSTSLVPYLQSIKHIFQVAYQYGNHLFTHAGVQRKWLAKYHNTLEDLREKFIIKPDEVADLLNAMNETHERYKLHEVGTKRGGLGYSYGGPTWCDQEEICSYGPMQGFHQVVGHTPQKYINKVNRFEGDKHYNNTSVTFIDVLGTKEQFLTVNI